MASLHLIITGRVQGVGFRWFVRETARRVGLAGWVCNLPDGSVELAAEGDEESLDLLRRGVEAGPPGAEVRNIRDVAGDAGPLTKPFSVRR